MTWLIALISIIPLFTGCGSNPEVVIEKNAEQKFATLSGKIGITIENNSGTWHYVIQQGKVIKVDSLPTAPSEAATILRKSFNSPPGLPPQVGYVYWGPYLMSPNKRDLAVSIATTRPALGSPGFVIVEVNTNTTIALLKGDENVPIRSLAWSPDSNWVAVLRASSTLGNLGRFLVSLTGHASPYMTWYLEVVNLSGDVVAQTKLTELQGSWGWVVWMD